MNPFRAWVSAKPVFIIWRGSDKSPIDPLHADPTSDYARSDGQNPSTWLSWEIATAYAQSLGAGYGVGIVIHEGSGLLCVDIDGCVGADGQLSEIAQKLIADAVRVCPDVYVEYSMSGKGVHIIGPYTGVAPLHSTKNQQLHLELYTAKRYIALTGNMLGTRGEPGGTLTDFLLATAWAYFKPSKVVGGTAATWTTEYDPLCTFTGTAAERIEALRKIKSYAARFSPGKITFADLQDVNVDKLAAQWPPNPDSKSGLPYDGNSVDQAYFNHLAYGFGNNCDAIEQYALSVDCPLHRTKWDERPDYVRGTILKAVALPKQWKRRNAPVAERAAPAPPVMVQHAPVSFQASQLVAPPIGHPLPVGVPQPPAVLAPALPAMLVNSKDKFEATLDYIERTLEADGLLSFDEFRNAVMIQKGVNRDVMNDADYIAMRLMFERERNFASVGKEIMRDACLLVASRRRYDSGIAWLNEQVWDGVPRVERFISTHFGAEDNEYTRAVGRYMWSGLAGRMFAPGCQLDMVIALQSRQGTGKSTGLAALVPDPDYFTDGLDLHKDDDNFKRMLRGKVVVEIAEMAGLSKGDIDVVKRVITRKAEKWIEKYQTGETVFNRRCMLFASTNKKEFLPADDTGQRRWLPVEITEINRALIVADRSQLWAEGAAIWKAEGIAYAEAERLAAGLHKHYEMTDVWEQRIGEWLDTMPPTGGPPPRERPLTVSEVLHGALSVPFSQMDGAKEKRAARVLKALGYESKAMRVEGIAKTVKRWVMTAPPPKFGP